MSAEPNSTEISVPHWPRSGCAVFLYSPLLGYDIGMPLVLGSRRAGRETAENISFHSFHFLVSTLLGALYDEVNRRISFSFTSFLYVDARIMSERTVQWRGAAEISRLGGCRPYKRASPHLLLSSFLFPLGMKSDSLIYTA